MTTTYSFVWFLAAFGFFSVSTLAGRAALADDPAPVMFKVTVTNVTAGNGLSPFLAVALKPNARLFAVGKPATPGIAAIAETGNSVPLQAELSARRDVLALAQASGGPISAGNRRSVVISVPRGALKSGAFLQLAAMIGRSNDSFVSIDALDLALVAKLGSVGLRASNYDAGSEENTGDVEDFGSGGHPVQGAEGRISADRGLNPRGNAPESLAWGSVAAHVLVERID